MTDTVSGPVRQRVTKALLPLRAVDVRLHEWAVDYVVDGTAAGVLEEIATVGRDTFECLLP